MEKKLGFGCMRLPLKDIKDQASIDTDAFAALLDLFIQRGGKYFDTAYFYHDGASESAVKTCLVDRHERGDFYLATKMPMMKVESVQEMEEIFALQLSRCGVDYFDYYLLHNLNNVTYQKVCDFDSFGFASRKKAEGRIGKLGFSFHGSPGLLERILTEHPETEFVQLQLNYLDWEDAKVRSRLCYETVRRFGKEVIVMEPCKGGELSTVPEEAEALMRAYAPNASPSSWAFRYAAGLEGVIMVLSGMNTREQIMDNTAVFEDISPLSAEERRIIARTVELINSTAAVKCTGCRYCVSICPQSIPIPDCFSAYNRMMRTGPSSGTAFSYSAAVENRGRAGDCIACRACTEECPQSLDIPGLLKDVSRAFDGN